MNSLAERLLGASLQELEEARRRIASDVIQTPLLSYPTGHGTIHLKTECLQPLGSFKIRAAANAVGELALDGKSLVTASAGNFAQGLALVAARRSLSLTVHAPDHAAEVKLAAIAALGAKIVKHSFDAWWQIMSERVTASPTEIFIHPVCETGVIIGNASIGLELTEQLPDCNTVVVPIGGGGLICGIALAFRALGKKVRIVGCEIETAAPLTAAFSAGRPIAIDRQPSFVDGIGSSFILGDMWPLLRTLVDEVVLVSLDEARQAVADLAVHSHIVAEGAGAVALAAARRVRGDRIAAVISGGNIDSATLAQILSTTRATERRP